jgi:hypothetical protein
MAVAADTTEAAAAVEAAVTTAEVAVADRIVEAAEVTQAVVDVAEENNRPEITLRPVLFLPDWFYYAFNESFSSRNNSHALGDFSVGFGAADHD